MFNKIHNVDNYNLIEIRHNYNIIINVSDLNFVIRTVIHFAGSKNLFSIRIFSNNFS